MIHQIITFHFVIRDFEHVSKATFGDGLHELVALHLHILRQYSGRLEMVMMVVTTAAEVVVAITVSATATIVVMVGSSSYKNRRENNGSKIVRARLLVTHQWFLLSWSCGPSCSNWQYCLRLWQLYFTWENILTWIRTNRMLCFYLVHNPSTIHLSAALFAAAPRQIGQAIISTQT